MSPIIFLLGEEPNFKNYRDAVNTSGGQVRLSPDPDDSTGCQGLLLPGGGDLDPALYGQGPRGSLPPDRLRDARELSLVKKFVAGGKPIFGVCRGLQLLNVFFGGTLIQDLPGHRQIDGMDQFHPVRPEPFSPLREQYGASFLVNSAHHQAVGCPGSGLRISARAADGVIEALWHETMPVFGVQWHPERLTGAFRHPAAADGKLLFDYFLSKCRR